jgi:hypothetical protein
MEKIPTPLDVIASEIERAIDAGLYYVAIAVSLSLPDICSVLTDEPGKVWSTEKKYVGWCKDNLEERFYNLTGEDIYRLRGGVLHQGSVFGHPKSRFNAVLFTVPNKNEMVYHENTFEHDGKRAVNLDVRIFCHTIIGAAREWYEANKNHAHVKINIENLVRFRPEGLAPYMVGMPLIA